MAGTIVADTLQDGAGNSTAMDNAIYGSAKAWCNYNGVARTIRGSYNVSSVTVPTAGRYQFNFTNAMPSVNYAIIGTSDDSASSGSLVTLYQSSPISYTTTSCTVNVISNTTPASLTDSYTVSVVVHM